MGKKGSKRLGIELDFKGKTAEQLKKEVDKKLDRYFKESIRRSEEMFRGVELPISFYREMENEKQRMRRVFYEKIDMELYMDRISSGTDFKRGSGWKF